MTTPKPDPEKPAPSARKSTTGSLLGGIGLGLLIATMGSIFVVALVKGYGRANETRDWTEVPMTVVGSGIIEQKIGENAPREYKAVIDYAFTFEGQELTGSGIKRTEGYTRHKTKAQRIIDRYPIGKKGTAWVNPANPQQTVLKHNTRAVLFTVWFPGLFVIAGLGIAVGAIRSHLVSKRTA